MYLYLQNKPIVGIVSGFASGIVVKVQHLLTDELIIKAVSGAAAWLGFFTALVTFAAVIGKHWKRLTTPKP